MQKYKSFEDWLKGLGFSESSGNYSAINQYGYLGKYQMGGKALTDAGYYTLNPNGKENDWLGKFTGKDDVYSKEDFLNNPQAQENAMRDYLKKQWGYLKHYGCDKNIGSTINGIEITPAGLLAGAHLKGVGGVVDYFNNKGNKIIADGNGTNIEKYFKQHSLGDVSEITTPNYYTPKWQLTNEEYVNRKTNQASNMIGQVSRELNPQTQMSDNMLNNVPVPAPLSKEEWMKRLKRQRMGLQ